MPHIAMLLSNGFRPDPRVAHEAKALVEAGCEVTVLCWDREDEFPANEAVDGYRIDRVQSIPTGYGAGPRQLTRTPLFWREAVRRVLDLGADVVHCHDLDTLPAGWWLKRRLGVPLVYDAHEDYARLMSFYLPAPMPWALARLERLLLGNVDQIISASSSFADVLRSKVDTPVAVIGNYPELASFEHVDEKSRLEVRASLGLSPQDLALVYVGGFSLTRELQPLLDAAALIPDIQIFIWGDGHQRPAVEAAAKAQRNLHYGGWLPADKVPAYFSAADVIYYCLTEGYPGWPNTLSNAMAAGRPLIANDVGDLGRIIREVECGILLEKVTPPTVANAAKELRSPRIRTRMGSLGKVAVRQRFNWQVGKEQLIQVYTDLQRPGD